MWDGVRKAFHILIHDCFQSFLLAVYSPPGRPLETEKELGLVVSVSPSVSAALVSTLATVSVHFSSQSLSRWSPHLPPQCQSTSVSVALVSTLATVSAHSVLKCLGHCPCGYADAAPLNESIINGYRRHSQNSCSYLLPQGLNPNPQVNTCLQSLQQLPLGLRCPK